MLPQQQQRILGYFIEEAKDHLNTIEQGLLNLQSTLNDPEMLNEVFRAAHSIKGGAAMLGLSSIQHTSHRLEDCFKVLKEHPVQVDQKLESLFLGVSDTLKALLEHLQQPFGLSEQTANDLMSEAEPVFQWLHEHLEELVKQSGGEVSISTVAEDKKATNQVDTLSTVVSPVDESAKQSVVSQTDRNQQVQAQVIQILREMLQLFKQSATSETRKSLQECCEKLAKLGEESNWLNWSNLCRKAARAIANTENTYLTLAKIVITEIKQSLELIVADKEGEIVASKQLESLIPAPEIELLEINLVEEPVQIAAEALIISDETPPTSTADSLSQDQTVSEIHEEEDLTELYLPTTVIELEPEDYITNLTDLSFNTDNTEKEDELFFGESTSDYKPPEVGKDELNSLADLFEGESPDLEITWEQVEILDISTAMELGIDLSDSDTKDSDSEFEFLFEQEANPRADRIDEQNNDLTLVQLFGDGFLEQEESEDKNQSTPGLVIEFSYDDQVTQKAARSPVENENFQDHKSPTIEPNNQETETDKISKSVDIILSPKNEISSLDDLFIENQEEQDLALLKNEIESTNLLDSFPATGDDISLPEDTESHFWEQDQQQSKQRELSLIIEDDAGKSLDDILNVSAAYDDIFADITDPISSTEHNSNLDELDISLHSEEQLNFMFLENADHDLFADLTSTDSESPPDAELYPDIFNFPQQQSNPLQSGNEPTDLSPEALEFTPEFTHSVSPLEVESEQSLPIISDDTATVNADNLNISNIDSPFVAIERDLADELFSTEASSNISFTDEHSYDTRQEFVDPETIDNLHAVFDFTETTGSQNIKQSQDVKQDFDDDLSLVENEIKAEDDLFTNTDNLDIYIQDLPLNEFEDSIESLLNLVDAEADSLNFLSEPSVNEAAKLAEPENYTSPSYQTTNSEIVENEDAVLSYLEAQADKIEHGEIIDSLDEFAQLDELLNSEGASNKREVSLPDQEIAALEDLLNLIPSQVELETQVEPTVSKGDINDQFKELVEMVKGDLQPRSTANRTPRFEQLMKVPVKHLDDLSNLVGELVVNRNTLEQDQERLRQSLDNLLTQAQQLSDVGTRMQELYERSLLEASLLASRKNNGFGSHSSDTDRGFSELEMDRFTPFHTLSQEMIELIVRVRESASDIDFISEETEQVARQFRQVTSQLQEGITRSRMEPFSEVTTPLERGVRESAIKYGKQARLVIEGRDTLIDKMILEHLKSPLTHLLNNAIAHGIETPEARQAAAKPPIGVITVRAFHQGNQTIISVQDDGRGIDSEGVKAKAIKKGIMTAEHVKNMSDVDVYDLLFQAGFTTKDQEDELAGRGVGLDVVLTRISEVRGTVSIDSTVGKGTTFTIRLPLTLSICKALCCVSDKARIAFPMDGVEDTLDIPVRNVQEDANQQKFIPWRDTVLPLRPLKELLTYNRQLSRGNVYGGNREDDMISVVVVRSANTLIALQIDQVLSEQEIVIKQFEGPAPKPVGVAGATILGDGRIMPIADVLEIVDIFQGRTSKQRGVSLWEQKGSSTMLEAPAVKIDPTVLIVDDSITVRELLSLSFNKAGYRVEQARDGQEAWDKLRSGLPCDIVFCDIEMPRCDGLELLSRIQKDSNLNHLPIAMLTSRGADKHRQMAIQLGASGYFTKPYLEEALLEAAARMLKGEKLVSAVPDKE